jgi:hypothetical protein
MFLCVSHSRIAAYQKSRRVANCGINTSCRTSCNHSHVPWPTSMWQGCPCHTKRFGVVDWPYLMITLVSL